MKIGKIKGFRDHYPEDMEIRNSIFNRMTSTAENFGYKRIDFPSLELLDMYRLKSGSELVNQTFSFTDRGGRDVTLIPEATPSTVRLLTSRKDLPRPIRWYSFPKVWRYEEPQEGRFREHYQFNSDLFGIDSQEADAEVVGLASKILDTLGLSGVYEININDRSVMEYILKDLDVSDINTAFSIIDKYRKIDKNSFFKLFKEIDVGEKSIDKITYLLSEKINIKNLEKKLRKTLNNYDGIEDRINRIKRTFEIINYYTDSNINYDFSVVRGLSYYTGIVFEAFDIQGELRAILGGGRYNNLSTLFSDEEIPAVGFAIGDAVIELLLKRNNLWLNNSLKTSYYICSTTNNYDYPVKIANDIRNKNKIALVDITNRKLSAQVKSASLYNYAIVIGDNEIKDNSITIKNMNNSEQKTIKYVQFMDSL